MRKNRKKDNNDISMMVLDDDSILTSSFESFFLRKGYDVSAYEDPYEAIADLREKKRDILLLDYLMRPICGDEVIERIREFDNDIFIILVTGHRDMVPPIETIWEFDIQGYYEKNGRLDQLEILVESCVKEIRQRRIIREYQRGMEVILDEMSDLYGVTDAEKTAEKMVSGAVNVLSGNKGYVRYRACENGDIFKTYGMDPDEKVNEKWISSSFFDESSDIEGEVSVEAGDGDDTNRKKLLDIYSRQAVSAAANNMLYERLKRSMDEKEKAHLETIHTLISAVELKDRYTVGHSKRVSALSSCVAREMGLDDETVERISLAGIFHDIGKIGIPDSILTKEGSLSDEEYELIRSHPVKGMELLSGISRLSDILDIVKCHHERIDGSGYPDGLSGSDIPLESRIISAVDAFDAMTSERTYGRALDVSEALDEIRKGAGTQFDSEVSAVLAKVISKGIDRKK